MAVVNGPGGPQKCFNNHSVCWGSFKNTGVFETGFWVTELTPFIVLMKLVYSPRITSIIEGPMGPFRCSPIALFVART